MRPSDISSRVAKSCAIAAGVREKVLRIDVPMVTLLVFIARAASHGMDPLPQASPVATSSIPRSSAIRTFSSDSRQSSPGPASSPSRMSPPSR